MFLKAVINYLQKIVKKLLYSLRLYVPIYDNPNLKTTKHSRFGEKIKIMLSTKN